MADDQDISPFSDDEKNATQLLQGLISPAPAQALVAPPPDTPPPTRPGESTPVTGSLATAPSQATPKRSPAPAAADATAAPARAYDAARAAQPEPARSPDALPIDPYQQPYRPGLGSIRRGLASYFSGGIGGAINAGRSAQSTPAQPAASLPDRSGDSNYVKVQSNGVVGYLPKGNLKKAQQRDKNLKVLK